MKDLTPFFSKLAHMLHPTVGKLYDWQPAYWNYAFVGGLGMIINWTVWMLLGMGQIAWWIGIFMAWNFNYLFSRYWVFRYKARRCDSMPCEVHRGKRGGRFYMARKKGGGTKRVYLKKGEKPPNK